MAKEKETAIRVGVRFDEADLAALKIDTSQRPVDMRNAIREKLGLDPHLPRGQALKLELREGLGLSAEASNREVQEAMVERLRAGQKRK